TAVATSRVSTTASGGPLSSSAGVFADVRTNSLLLVGTPDELRPLEAFVQQIDVLLAQVLIEAMIMEVTLTNDRDFGVSVVRRGLDHAAKINNLAINPVDLATTAIPAAASGGLTYFASIQAAKLDIVAQALATDNDVNVLSRPVIQTSHNEEAKIFVGETRPFVTATATDITGGSTALRSQFENKEIGLELTVKPLINPDGLVVLDIKQKIEDISGFQTIDGNDIPVTSKREASSVVSVQDGSLVILGGLTSNNRTHIKKGVPILRDIPLIGYLFSDTQVNKRKTELMVFLQPTVLKTPEAAAQEAIRRQNGAKELIKLRERLEPPTARKRTTP
ncbi:MAG: hypothetical protein JO317_02320, partial [Verrucomicrobiae bacterium]|nr:hypothetical protein [Verrucomicrobiae bacterium]